MLRLVVKCRIRKPGAQSRRARSGKPQSLDRGRGSLRLSWMCTLCNTRFRGCALLQHKSCLTAGLFSAAAVNWLRSAEVRSSIQKNRRTCLTPHSDTLRASNLTMRVRHPAISTLPSPPCHLTLPSPAHRPAPDPPRTPHTQVRCAAYLHSHGALCVRLLGDWRGCPWHRAHLAAVCTTVETVGRLLGPWPRALPAVTRSAALSNARRLLQAP
jgi:hypothetical protein